MEYDKITYIYVKMYEEYNGGIKISIFELVLELMIILMDTMILQVFFFTKIIIFINILCIILGNKMKLTVFM